MTSVLNSTTHAAQQAKKADKSSPSAKHGLHAPAAAGEFASLFGAMAGIDGGQELATPAVPDGKASPPLSGLASEVLGPTVHIITTKTPATSDDSLLAFARAQGMDENALAMIFGRSAPAPAAANTSDVLSSSTGISGLTALNAGQLKDAAGLASALSGATAAKTTTPAGTQSVNRLDLGPEASMQWTVGQADAQATSKEAPQLMFGLNGTRAALPGATQEVAAPVEEATHPEAANQNLAASLILGASEASQFAKRLQMKQTTQRTEKFAQVFTQSERSAQTEPELISAGAPLAEVQSEIATLDTGLSAADTQLIMQHKASEDSTTGQTNASANSGASADAAPTSHADLNLRAEQYEKLSQRMGEALGQRLAAQIAKGDWKVELALKPHDLGSIDIQLSMKQGSLEASFNASQSQTRDLIIDGLPKLKEVLAQLGMEVASMNVNVRQNGQNGGNPTPGRQSSSGTASVAAKSGAGEISTTATLPTGRTTGTSTDGLDVLV